MGISNHLLSTFSQCKSLTFFYAIGKLQVQLVRKESTFKSKQAEHFSLQKNVCTIKLMIKFKS